MMYRLDILGTTDTDAVTVLFSPDITVRRWSKRISAAGSMVFTMQAANVKATPETLRMFRRVVLSRRRNDAAGYAKVWSGYIEEVTQFGDEVEVLCVGMLKFFRKRWCDTNQAFTGQGSADAFSLLEDTNDDDGETCVTEGDGGVTSTRNVTMSGDVDILKAWELLAQAHEAEFEIDDDFAFHFVEELGSDKSGTVILTHRRDGRLGTNVRSIRRGEVGADMATVLILSSAAGGGITSTYTSANTATYGVVIDRRTFNEAQDQTALDAMKDALGPQLENPLTDFEIVPELESLKLDVISGDRTLSGMAYEDVVVGDLLTINVITENQSISEAKRVVEIRMDVSDDGMETMALTLSEAGVFISAGYLDAARIPDLTRRVKQIESVLS